MSHIAGVKMIDDYVAPADKIRLYVTPLNPHGRVIFFLSSWRGIKPHLSWGARLQIPNESIGLGHFRSSFQLPISPEVWFTGGLLLMSTVKELVYSSLCFMPSKLSLERTEWHAKLHVKYYLLRGWQARIQNKTSVIFYWELKWDE